jgi:hypothetical protein
MENQGYKLIIMDQWTKFNHNLSIKNKPITFKIIKILVMQEIPFRVPY